MRYKIKFSAIMVVFIFFTLPARAFFSDAPILIQILANSLKQLVEMQRIVQSGQDSLGLMREVNRGINDSLRAIDTLGGGLNPGLFKELSGVVESLARLKGVYGDVVKSPDEKAQRETDQAAAEAIAANNQIFRYAENLDRIGERIKSYSHEVSPGGAAKLTAESLGVLIHVMNQQLRATGLMMKLSAQTMAVQNKREKDATRAFVQNTETMKAALKNQEPQFKFPRF